MLLFQNGQADGVSTDDTVLAGLAAQDPYSKVLDTDPLTREPYGIGVNKDNRDLVRLINKVLEDMRDDGRWQASYDRWLKGPLKVTARSRRRATDADGEMSPATMTAPTSARAPVAPGAMGSAPEPAVLSAYLVELDGWVRARKAELDDLDGAAISAGRGAEVAADMALSMSLWKGVADRYAEMWAAWDGGRVLEPQRQRIAALIWGRLAGVRQRRCPRRASSPTPWPAS